MGIHFSPDGSDEAEELLTSVFSCDATFPGKYLYLIHPINDDHLKTKILELVKQHGVANAAFIPYTARSSNSGGYWFEESHEFANRVHLPSVRLEDLRRMDRVAIGQFMRADWRSAPPWSLLFPSVPYASISLCLVAAMPVLRADMEDDLAAAVRGEARGFGVHAIEDALTLARSVLAVWSR